MNISDTQESARTICPGLQKEKKELAIAYIINASS